MEIRTSGKMAALASCQIFEDERNLDLNTAFELDIKNKLTWSFEKWNAEGDGYSKLKTFVNSLRFWSKKLKKALGPKNILITLYELSGDISEHLDIIVDDILKLDSNIELSGFSTFRNSKYIALYFKTEEMKLLVESKLRIIGQYNVAFLSWALDMPVKNLRVHWVPYDVDMTIVREELNKYFILREEEREFRVLMRGLILPSGNVNFKALLKKDVDVDEIPHLTEIAGFEALITIQGRQIQCLTCGLKGHKSKNCMTPYCVICNCLKPKVHKCVKNITETLIQEEVRKEVGTIITPQIYDGSIIEKSATELQSNAIAKTGNLLHGEDPPNYIRERDKVCSVRDMEEKIQCDRNEEVKKVQKEEGKGASGTSGQPVEKFIIEPEDDTSSEEGFSEQSDGKDNAAMDIVENYIKELNSCDFVKMDAVKDVSKFIKDGSAEIDSTKINKKRKEKEKKQKSVSLNKKTRSLDKDELKFNCSSTQVQDYSRRGGGTKVRDSASYAFDNMMDKG